MEKPASSGQQSWLRHMSGTLILGLPLIGTQLAQLAINTTDVLIVGHLGALDLAAIVLASQYFITILFFGSGFSTAAMPLVAHAMGSGRQQDVRHVIQAALWVSLLYSILVLPLFLVARPILLWMGQQPEVVGKASSYLAIVGFAIAPALYVLVLKSLLSAVGKTRILLTANLVCVISNIALAYTFTLGHFGSPVYGLAGAAAVAVAVEVLFATLLAAYVTIDPSCRKFGVHNRILRQDSAAIKEVITHGVPISLMILSEISLFSVASIMMGWIGTLELAAYGIAMQFAAAAFMIPLGLSQAATVRVGMAAGRSDGRSVLRAGVAAIVLASALALAACAIFVLNSQQLVRLFIDDTAPNTEQLVSVAAPFLVMAGAFQVFDGLQTVCAGLSRGIKDTTVPMMLAVVSYWGIGFTCAYALAFPLGFGAIGIWYGFIVGLGAAAILLNLRFFSKARKLVAAQANPRCSALDE